jgi:plastocyanin
MLRRTLPLAVLALVAALLFAATASSKTQATPTLVGTTGPGFTITLTLKGKPVKKLKAGTYKFVVHDKAAIHNFVVEKEKGSNKIEKDVTSVSFVGTKTATIKLTPGGWKYYCAPHESAGMGHDFTVTM